jgi:hypothetical protein
MTIRIIEQLMGTMAGAIDDDVVGKGARFYHRESEQQRQVERPFFKKDCSSIAPSLFVSHTTPLAWESWCLIQ